MSVYTESLERFKLDTEKHQMKILHDEGLYRHVRFQTPRDSAYWFDLVTWPGHLSIVGDLDGFAFARVPDMFAFFRESSRVAIQPHYWAEKVVSGSGNVRGYSEKKFLKDVAEALAEAEKDYPGVTKDWNESTAGLLAQYDLSYREGADWAVNDFIYTPEGSSESFDFADFGIECDPQDFSWEYLWSCQAIASGVAQYDAAKAVTA